MLSPDHMFRGFRSAPRVLFVDPLDGTREFIARNGEFPVMIGLLEGARALAGAVLAPEAGRGWVGALGLARLGTPRAHDRRDQPGRRPLQ